MIAKHQSDFARGFKFAVGACLDVLAVLAAIAFLGFGVIANLGAETERQFQAIDAAIKTPSP